MGEASALLLARMRARAPVVCYWQGEHPDCKRFARIVLRHRSGEHLALCRACARRYGTATGVWERVI